MAFYFKSSQIPELKDYTFTERARIITQAQAYFTVPDKFIVNIAKLLVLSPLFIMVAKFEEWWMLLPMIVVVFCYPLITNPIQLNIAKKYLPQAIKVFKAESEQMKDQS